MITKELSSPEPSVEIYSSLLSEAIKSWKLGANSEVRLEHPGSDNLLDQYVLVEGNSPKTAENLTLGFCINSHMAYFIYRQRFQMGFVQPYGKIISVRHAFESGNQFMGRQKGKYKREPIMRMFSPIGAQIVANEFDVSILDTIEIDLADRDERGKLEALGYNKRFAYPVYEKIYRPEGA